MIGSDSSPPVGARPDQADRALGLLRRHGWNSTSFQSLEPGFCYWFAPEGDAVVAYVDTGAAWVAAGAPIGALDRLAAVAAGFEQAGRDAGRRVCYFAVERRFLDAAPVRSVGIGEQPVWDPRRWSDTLGSSRSLREQLRRARAKGVTVRPIDPGAFERGGADRDAVEGLIGEWLGGRRLAPMGFLVQVHPFSYGGERMLLVAEWRGRIVGFLGMVPVYARKGWLFEDLLRGDGSPNGTAELLIDAAMRAAAEAGSEYATLGLAPLAGPVDRWARAVRSLGRGLYHFEGLRAFKSRLRPDRWDPIFTGYPATGSRLAAIFDSVTAFAPGGLLRFALRSVVGRPAAAIRLLAALLIPWTMLLWLAAPSGWFPSEAVRAAWILFDIGLIIGLWRLGRSWSQTLARCLAALVTVDALLTAFQLVAFNFRTPSRGELVMGPAAVLGPCAAAALLWAAVINRDRMGK